MPASFHWLVHKSPMLMAALDRTLVCRHISDPWRELLGLPPVHRLARPVADLFGPENRSLVLQHLEEVLEHGSCLEKEPVSFKTRGGSRHGELSAWQVKAPNAEHPWLLVAVREVGEQKEALGQLSRLQTLQQLILNATGDGIYGVDAQGRTTFVNAAATRILGWQENDLLGQALHAVSHHSHLDGSPYSWNECPLYAALKDGETHRVENEVFWRADGTPLAVEYTSTPIRRNGKLDGAVVVFRDISRRKQLQSQRAEAFDQLSELTEQLTLERDYLRHEISVATDGGELVGNSEALQRTLAQIEAVAPTQANVLVEGEAGVGKEGIARAIHSASARADHVLVKVNCACVPADAFERELFGHVEGAFTGADQHRVGRIQQADAGTLFLDEVAEIPLTLQGKLLRVLQEQEYSRVGEDFTHRVDVRVIAATSRDLMREVKQGRFREDLYYRLSVCPIAVPALRERLDDIEPLTFHFLHRISQHLGRNTPLITRQQLADLKTCPWAGNILELKNVLEKAVLLAQGERLQLDLSLPDANSKLVQAGFGEPDPGRGYVSDAAIREIEKANILSVLRYTDFRVSGSGGAAELLGLKASTLAYRMKVFGIDKATL